MSERAAPTFQGVSLDEWGRLLTDADPHTRERAANALASIGAAAIPYLAGALLSGNTQLGAVALRSLARIGTTAVPAMASAFDHQEAEIRRLAAQELRRMGPAVVQSMPIFVKALHDEDWHIRSSMVTVPGFVARASSQNLRELLPHMIQRFDDSTLVVRMAAVNAVGGLGPTAQTAIPALERLLEWGRIFDCGILSIPGNITLQVNAQGALQKIRG